jgi:hypothetical protein
MFPAVGEHRPVSSALLPLAVHTGHQRASIGKGTIMGIWVRTPELAGSETVLWSRTANRTQSERRAIGGRLFLTQSRLIFEPSRFDGAFGGDRWWAPLSSIRKVGSQLPDGRATAGGLRTRLRLDLADGAVELFVVNRLDDVIQVIGQAAVRPG